jgi:hypothetical protein
MAYQRIATPRIYPCSINHSLSLGRMASTDLTQAGITSASPIEMFDLQPASAYTIGGDDSTTQHIIKINTQMTTDSYTDNNYMLILGHNLEQSGVKFKLQHSDSSTFADDSVVNPALTELVNIGGNVSAGSGDDFDEANYATPGNNGWSLFTWTSGGSDNQYYRLTLDSVAGNYDDDIKISCIIMGEYWSFPHAPDMAIQKILAFGNTIQESVGGMTYSNASWLAAPPWGGMVEAFENKNHTTPHAMRKAGKFSWDLNFSYMTDSDVFYPELYQEQDIFTDSSFMGNVLQRTFGTHHPFLIQWSDSAVGSVYDNFSWVRLADVPKFNQVANQVWNANVSLVEQF